MRKGRFSEEQMVAIIREADRDPVAAVAKRHGISEQTIYTWRKRFGGLQASDVKRLRQLEVENGRLKKLVAERDLEIEVMKEVAAKKWWRAGSPAASGVWPGAWPLGAAGLHAVLSGAIGVGVSQPEGRGGCACGHADEGAVGAVSAVRLSAHPHFPQPRRPSHEPRPGAPAVANGKAAGAAQAAEEAHSRCAAATPASTEWAEPGVVLRLRVRPLRQWSAAQVPDRRRRVHQGRLGDRCRRPHPLRPRHRGVVTPGERARRPEVSA